MPGAFAEQTKEVVTSMSTVLDRFTSVKQIGAGPAAPVGARLPSLSARTRDVGGGTSQIVFSNGVLFPRSPRPGSKHSNNRDRAGEPPLHCFPDDDCSPARCAHARINDREAGGGTIQHVFSTR